MIFWEPFWHVSVAVGLILQQLCSLIGNRIFWRKTEQNFGTEWTPHSVHTHKEKLILSKYSSILFITFKRVTFWNGVTLSSYHTPHWNMKDNWNTGWSIWLRNIICWHDIKLKVMPLCKLLILKATLIAMSRLSSTRWKILWCGQFFSMTAWLSDQFCHDNPAVVIDCWSRLRVSCTGNGATLACLWTRASWPPRTLGATASLARSWSGAPLPLDPDQQDGIRSSGLLFSDVVRFRGSNFHASTYFKSQTEP